MEPRPPQELADTQARISRLVSDPAGVEAALESAGGEPLAAWIREDRGLGAAERLAVYANAFFARLHDALREDYGALARALGPDAFHDLVQTYLMLHPPTRPSLRHAGLHLAGHLATEPFAEIFARRCAYAADLARLEWALAEAFCAEDSPLLAREDLAACAPSDFGGLRFEPAPSLRLLELAWPVHEVRERFDAEDPEASWDEAPPLAAARAFVRVWRRDEQVRYRAISELEHEALLAARAGESFARICERLARAVGDAEAAGRAAALLSSWVADGLIAGLRRGGR